MSTITESILDSTKKVLGVDAENVDFDVDIIMHINSVFSILGQLGVGPVLGFMIEDSSAQWSNFLDDVMLLNHVKTYVYLRVKLLFDPPSSSYVLEAQKRQYEELEWRISVYRENALIPVVVIL